MRHWLALKFIVDQIWIFIKGLFVRSSASSSTCLISDIFPRVQNVKNVSILWNCINYARVGAQERDLLIGMPRNRKK